MTGEEPNENPIHPAGWFAATFGPEGRVVLDGELDITGVNALRAVLDQALLATTDSIKIDASALSFIDSIGISELLRYEIIASTQQRDLFLESVSEPVLVVLEMLDLRSILMSDADDGT